LFFIAALPTVQAAQPRTAFRLFKIPMLWRLPGPEGPKRVQGAPLGKSGAPSGERRRATEKGNAPGGCLERFR
jgi:hypothetical protein